MVAKIVQLRDHLLNSCTEFGGCFSFMLLRLFHQRTVLLGCTLLCLFCHLYSTVTKLFPENSISGVGSVYLVIATISYSAGEIHFSGEVFLFLLIGGSPFEELPFAKLFEELEVALGTA